MTIIYGSMIETSNALIFLRINAFVFMVGALFNKFSISDLQKNTQCPSNQLLVSSYTNNLEIGEIQEGGHG